MISVENLTKYYGNFQALNSVSFNISAGEVVGFLGPNGAGKTTTMKILAGFMPAASGNATIAGFDVYQESLDVRKNLGYLPESAPIYSDLNVWEYLSFMAAMHDIPVKHRRKQIKDVVEICGLKDRLRSEMGELSKGYKQRVGLAASLIHNPKVLILDEPTSGLDPNQIIEIRNVIRDIGKEKTVILSSHILSEVEATCSRIIIINEGKITAQGTAAQLRDLAQGVKTVRITAQGSQQALEEVVTKIPGVIKVSSKTLPDHFTALTIETERGQDLRKELGLALYHSNHPILELRQEDISLENIFTQLTH